MASVPRPSPEHGNPWWVLLAAVTVVAAAPFAVWSWVGDQSRAGTDLDYIRHPPTLSTTQEWVLFVASTLAVILGVVVLVKARAKGATRPPILAVTAIVASYAGAVGFGYRIVTAGVIGANIGGGLLLLAAPPVTIATALALVWILVAHRRRIRARPSPPM